MAEERQGRGGAAGTRTQAGAKGKRTQGEHAERDGIREKLYVSFELLVTIAMDTAVLLGVVFARMYLLRALALLGPQNHGWALTLVEKIFDFGLVGTVLVITVFDLLKRIWQAWKRLTHS